MGLQTDSIFLDILDNDPVSPAEGQIWFNTSSKEIKTYKDGSTSQVESRKTTVSSMPPSTTNDLNEGYEIGSRWIDSTMKVEYVCFDSSAGSAVWVDILQPYRHKTLVDLIHFIDEGPAQGFASGATKEVTGTVFPTNVVWKRANATKLVEQLITWTGAFPTTIQWRIFDLDGATILGSVTDVISYSGPFETGRTRTIS
jgi:hypothetical protein